MDMARDRWRPASASWASEPVPRWEIVCSSLLAQYRASLFYKKLTYLAFTHFAMWYGYVRSNFQSRAGSSAFQALEHREPSCAQTFPAAVKLNEQQQQKNPHVVIYINDSPRRFYAIQ